jgi:hypothetical protein
MPAGAPQSLLLSRTEPGARNGLSLAHNGLRSRVVHSGVNVPDLLLCSLPTSFPARSALLLCYRHRFAPVPATSMLVARCSSTAWHNRLRFRSPLPVGTFTSLRIKAFYRICRRLARLPKSPDLPSLPAASSISRFGYGSSFQVRRSLLSQFQTPTTPRRAVGFFGSGHSPGHPSELITQLTLDWLRFTRRAPAASPCVPGRARIGAA